MTAIPTKNNTYTQLRKNKLPWFSDRDTFIEATLDVARIRTQTEDIKRDLATLSIKPSPVPSSSVSSGPSPVSSSSIASSSSPYALPLTPSVAITTGADGKDSIYSPSLFADTKTSSATAGKPSINYASSSSSSNTNTQPTCPTCDEPIIAGSVVACQGCKLMYCCNGCLEADYASHLECGSIDA